MFYGNHKYLSIIFHRIGFSDERISSIIHQMELTLKFQEENLGLKLATVSFLFYIKYFLTSDVCKMVVFTYFVRIK